jgi:hypothetical protein
MRPLGDHEQRRHPRYLVDLPATFFNDRTSGFVKVGNISAGGCRLASHVILSSGDVGQLLIEVPGGTASLKISEAVVRWVIGNECGLQFIDLDQEDRQGLHQFTNQLALGAH